jgi:hypothetical protein
MTSLYLLAPRTSSSLFDAAFLFFFGFELSEELLIWPALAGQVPLSSVSSQPKYPKYCAIAPACCPELYP